jgi:hypothetical protein
MAQRRISEGLGEIEESIQGHGLYNDDTLAPHTKNGKKRMIGRSLGILQLA